MLQLKRRDPALMPTVEELQEAVEAHVEEEETTLFPRVEEAADEAALDRLGAQMETDAPALLDEDLLENDADQPSP
jgi:hemerythrin superfamily protein